MSADTLSSLALSIVGAVKVGLAKSPHFGGLTGDVAIASEPWGTFALVSRVSVPTHSVGCKILFINMCEKFK